MLGQNFNGQLGTGDRIDLSSPERCGARTLPTGLAATTASASAALTWNEPTSPYGPQTWEVEGSTNGVGYRFRVTATTPLDSITITITLASAVTPSAVIIPQVPSTPTTSASSVTPPTERWPFAPADRIAGDDPADVAAAMSRRRFATGSAPTVHVAVASRLVDAAAAGAAAVSVNGPVLLVNSDSLPSSTVTEIRRLASRRVVVVGGSNAISDEVVDALGGLDGVTVTRVQGADRSATAASVSRTTYRPGVDTVYLVSAASAIDGLGVARFGRPVLLTGRTTLPRSTVDELRRLQPARTVVIGGTSVVSATVIDELDTLLEGSVVRWAGTDRAATTALVASTDRVGMGTAVLIDAHTPAGGMAMATLLGDPGTALLLARPTCVPAASRAVIDRWNPTTVLTVSIDPDLTRSC